jgi:ribA/ribD-fused uncharacterized protein
MDPEWWDKHGPVLFYGGIYSQWHRASFFVDGERYPTAEHFMMAEKARLFGDADSLRLITANRDPSEVKRIGRQVRGWHEEKWKAARFQIVCRGSYEKFRQNSTLRDQLLATGNREIVEASPYDVVWGVGRDTASAQRWYEDQMESAAPDQETLPWPGLNLLGKALMVARDMLTPR